MSKCGKKPYDFQFFQGDDHSFTVAYKNADGTAKALTDYTAQMQARAAYDSADTVLEISDSDGLTIDEALGKIAVALDNETTAAIPPGVYVYDLEIISPAGIKKKLIFGKMTVLAEVTKA